MGYFRGLSNKANELDQEVAASALDESAGGAIDDLQLAEHEQQELNGN
ncbi:hypothetical protein P0Y43_23610 [Pseudomonas entomophila]|nr:hypothetical protein [Pseudomonas entomophila]MDF0733673.1 hypothetical protein [Pseudomonas entomophila]